MDILFLLLHPLFKREILFLKRLGGELIFMKQMLQVFLFRCVANLQGFSSWLQQILQILLHHHFIKFFLHKFLKRLILHHKQILSVRGTQHHFPRDTGLETSDRRATIRYLFQTFPDQFLRTQELPNLADLFLRRFGRHSAVFPQLPFIFIVNFGSINLQFALFFENMFFKILDKLGSLSIMRRLKVINFWFDPNPII